MHNRNFYLTPAGDLVLFLVIVLLALAGTFAVDAVYKSRESIWRTKVEVQYRWDNYDPADTIRTATYESRFSIHKSVDSVAVRIFSCDGNTETGEYHLYGEVACYNEGKIVQRRGLEELLFKAPGMKAVNMSFKGSANKLN